MAGSKIARGATASSGRARLPRVVGIGASAGGINALQSLFLELRTRPNLAFVVIQHLGRGWPSQLVEIVGRWSTLPASPRRHRYAQATESPSTSDPSPVRQAVDGERPKRGHVYIAGAEDVLTLERGVFRTRPAALLAGGAFPYRPALSLQ